MADLFTDLEPVRISFDMAITNDFHPKASAIIGFLERIKTSDFEGDESMRLKAISAGRALIARLELPAERARELSVEHNIVFASVKTLIDAGLWQRWYEVGGGVQSLSDLVNLANADMAPNLLRRLLRLLTAVNIVEEVGQDHFKPTDFSLWLGDKTTMGAQMLLNHTHHTLDASRNLPEFLRKTSYHEPTDPLSSTYADSNPEGLSIWERLARNPDFRLSWAGGMGVWARWKTHWPDMYDTSRLLDGADMSAPLVVDIGGNDGNDLKRFLERHPDVPDGALVLQDRPEALAKAEVGPKIRKMPCDFFTSQPVKGSRAYFLHSVIHDWPDKEAIGILRNTAQAMKPGYSRLLVSDIVMPPTGATVFQATIDLQLMSQHSGGERTEEVWHRIMAEAGLRITEIFNDPKGHDGVIEAELL